MTTEEEVLNFIVAADGRRVTSDEVRDRFAIKETVTGNFNTRTIIKDALRNHAIAAKQPIGADGKGYFLIKTHDQLRKYRDNLRARISGIQERIDLVEAAWEK